MKSHGHYPHNHHYDIAHDHHADDQDDQVDGDAQLKGGRERERGLLKWTNLSTV